VDVVRTGFGIKGDEATYVSMALSLADDGDLSWDRGDLERFYQAYGHGPEGIFLKRGQTFRLRSAASFPWVRVEHRPDRFPERLYFGKAFAYAVAAAPFVWAAGLNGLLLFHVLAWGLCVWAGYVYLRARSGELASLLFSLAFLGVSITPIYLVWLTPEIFHVALVFLAYFLVFYRDVAPPAHGRWARVLRGRGALWVAAVLLGVATFSKPPNLFLVGPPAVLLWHQRRWLSGLAFGLVAGVAVVACFAVNGVISGDLNYQGGDRKTFYGQFPFARPDVQFDTSGIVMSTNELGADEIQEQEGFFDRLRLNALYFTVGRHSGFLPYFFPGVVTLALWLVRRREQRLWHWAILTAVVATVLVLMVTLPYSWAGGGGPPGNRYFLSLYPSLFFLTPTLASVAPAVVAWVGGAVFLAHVLVNPFVSAKSPWTIAQRGLLRQLPVELTMVNDLPVMLQASRARVPYGTDPVLFLYFLDDHTWSPEPTGLWVAGGATSEIIVRTDEPLDRLSVTLQAAADSRVRLRAGGGARDVTLSPGTLTTVSVPARGVSTRGSFAYLLVVSTTAGAVPALEDPSSRDSRFLGVLMRLQGQTAPPAGAR
jgi:hypothetical protein